MFTNKVDLLFQATEQLVLPRLKMESSCISDERKVSVNTNRRSNSPMRGKEITQKGKPLSTHRGTQHVDERGV